MTQTKAIQKAAIYCRGEADKAYQAGIAMAYIIDHKLTFSGLYEDDEDLNAWQRLMTDCAAGKIDVIIVQDIDAIASDDNMLIFLEEQLSTVVIGAADLYCTKEDFNLETFQWDTQRPSTSESIQERKDEGKSFGRVPYGYEKSGDRLIAKSDTAKVVKEIFDAAKAGQNPTSIRNYLNQMQIPTPGKSRQWSRDSVLNILTNDMYCGSEFIETVISKVDFDQANEVVKEKRSSKGDEPFPIARCAVCNSKLVYQKAGSIPRQKATTYFCGNKHTPKIRIEDMTTAVLEQCNEFLESVDRYPESPDVDSRIVELGQKVLEQQDIHSEDYEGLWKDGMEKFRNVITHAERILLREQYGHMDEYNPKIGTKIIRSIRLDEDGDVKVNFWGEEV